MSRVAILAGVALTLTITAARADQAQWSEAWGSPAFVDQTAADTGAAIGRPRYGINRIAG